MTSSESTPFTRPPPPQPMCITVIKLTYDLLVTYLDKSGGSAGYRIRVKTDSERMGD